MRKKIVFIILYIVLEIFLTGCCNARELEELGISLLISLDIENDKVLLTGEVVDPSYTQSDGTSTEGSSVKYVQGTGNNIHEAFRDITLKFDRRLFISHNKVIIIGEELAKRGLVKHMDQLFRNNEQRETTYILIAKGTKGYEVMGINSGLEQIPANYISKLIENIEYNPKTRDVSMVEYLKTYYHKGHQPTVGVIEKKTKKEIDQTVEKAGAQSYELSVIGSAVFDKDVLVGYLNGNDTKSLNFIADNVKGGIITFPTPKPVIGVGMENEPIHKNLSSMLIINNKTKNDIEIKDDNIVLKTKIKLRGAVGEVVGNIDISKEENLKELEKACSKAAEEGIKSAVTKVQKEFGLDIFGFGLVFHRKYPEEWKNIKENWDEIFSKADFEIEVETDIIRTGLINTPIVKEKGK